MRTTFSVREHEYQLALDKHERAEADKFHPFAATVTRNGGGGAVQGTLQYTPEALSRAERLASEKGGSAEGLLAEAGARALAAELLLRKLKPDFSFIVDHRWVD